jgi:hypothetical protein
MEFDAKTFEKITSIEVKSSKLDDIKNILAKTKKFTDEELNALMPKLNAKLVTAKDKTAAYFEEFKKLVPAEKDGKKLIPLYKFNTKEITPGDDSAIYVVASKLPAKLTKKATELVAQKRLVYLNQVC